MSTNYINYRDTNYFSDLICDYIDKKKATKQFYNRFPTLDNFKAQIDEKSQNYKHLNRPVLVSALQKQYSGYSISEATQENINNLKLNTTYTVTTGHQLNLFTGPLYFLYKIISNLNLTSQLKNKYADYNFVPVYWMASEDHDFQEINFFKFEGKKIQWNKQTNGAVGRLSTKELDKVFNVFESQLSKSKNAQKIASLFKVSYLEHNNLTDATRFLANELFGDSGLVVIDGDNKSLKSLFKPHVEDELINSTSEKYVNKTSKLLEQHNYNVQVNPRAINLFYLKDGFRERIIHEDKIYRIISEDIDFTTPEILNEIQRFPERFSPNVIMRPLYQEVILPNLCYIGGGGELAYWFQLKSYFNSLDVSFPILLPRNSVLLTTEKQNKKLKKFNLKWQDIFKNQHELINHYTKAISKIDIDFSKQKQHLVKQFVELYKIARQTDQSFLGAVAAQERKQIKGLERLEKRLLKAQKRNLSAKLERLSLLQNELFPEFGLQERNSNFSEFYLKYGEHLFQELENNLQPLNMKFLILEL